MERIGPEVRRSVQLCAVLFFVKRNLSIEIYIANVTPVLKKGKEIWYRSVNLTSIPEKVMEQLVLSTLFTQP